MAGFYRSTVAIARVLLALALVYRLHQQLHLRSLLMAFFWPLLLPLRLIRVDVDGLSIVLLIALEGQFSTLEGTRQN